MKKFKSNRPSLVTLITRDDRYVCDSSTRSYERVQAEVI